MRRGLRLGAMRAVTFALIGGLLFGLVGALWALRSYPTYQATLQMRVYPDPALSDDDPASDIPTEEFLAGELLLLDDPTSSSTLGAGQRVDVTQVGSTNVLQVVATANTRPSAVEAAESVFQDYSRARARALTTRITNVGNEVDAQLAAAAARIAALSGNEDITANVNRDALTAEYTRLLGLQNSLRIASAAGQRIVQVSRPATVEGTTQISDPLRSAVVLGVLGTVVGLGAALALSRWRRWVSGIDDVLDLTPELALPTLPNLAGQGRALRAGEATGPYVSALTDASGRFAEPALLVVAPTEGTGSTTVAVGLAVASARRGPTVFVALGDALDGSAARLLGVRRTTGADPLAALPTAVEGLSYVGGVSGHGETALLGLERIVSHGLLDRVVEPGCSVIIDAPSLSRSPVALDLARNGAHVLLVGGVEHSTASEMQAAAASLRRVGGRLVAVVLSTPRAGLLRRRPPKPRPAFSLRPRQA